MDVALKVLHEHLVGDEPMVHAFRREAELMRLVEHPGVVRVFGTTEVDGRPAIAMEFCAGGTLSERLIEGGALEQTRAVEIMVVLLDALDVLHDHGIVHRDVKPHNILFDDSDRPKLIDFGIGQADELIADDAGQIGTVEYMAPERIDGLAIDGRSDVYSAGVVLFEMVCGQVPYRADSASAVMRMHREGEPPHPELFADGLLPRVSEAIRRAMSTHPEQRFDSAGQMKRVLDGSRPMRDSPSDHPTWEALAETYGGDSPLIADVEAEQAEWVVFVVDYDDFGSRAARQLREIFDEHREHLAVPDTRVRNLTDVVRAGTTVAELLESPDETAEDGAQARRDEIRWRQMFGAYGVARGLSKRGAERLVEQLEEIGIVARFARRRRRRRTPTLLSRVFSPDHLAATAIITVICGVVVYLMAAQRFAEEGGQMSPALAAGFLAVCAVAAITSAWAASAEMISELWRSKFSRRYLLDFSRTSADIGGDSAVGRRHVELAGSIRSPRIAASFRRALNMALHLKDVLEEHRLEASARIDEVVAEITDLAHRINQVEQIVAAIRPGEVTAGIRRLDARIAGCEDIERVDALIERKAELRDQLQRRDRAQQRLQEYGQRLLEIANRLEQMVRRYADRPEEIQQTGESEEDEAVVLDDVVEQLAVLDFDVEPLEETEQLEQKEVVGASVPER